MHLHDASAETAFLATFDGRFPYEDAGAAEALMERGWSISLNAAFCVLNEICRPPFRGRVSEERCFALIAEWSAGPEHPLKAPLLECAEALIRGQPIAWEEGFRRMLEISRYDGQRAALGIVYSASDSSTEEGDATLDEAHAEICRLWDSRGV